MSNRKKKWCSYCGYKAGHGMRQCASLKRNAADGDYYAKSIIEKWAEANEVRKQRVKDGDFFCSYCGTRGHRRGQCEFLKADKEWFLQELNAFRQEHYEAIHNMGLGAGALGTLSYNGWWRKSTYPFISLGWDWNSIHMIKRNSHVSKIILNIFLPSEGVQERLEFRSCGGIFEPLYKPHEPIHSLGGSGDFYSGTYKVDVVSSKDLGVSREELLVEEKSPFVKAVFSTKRTPKHWGITLEGYSSKEKYIGRTLKHEELSYYRSWYNQNKKTEDSDE